MMNIPKKIMIIPPFLCLIISFFLVGMSCNTAFKKGKNDRNSSKQIKAPDERGDYYYGKNRIRRERASGKKKNLKEGDIDRRRGTHDKKGTDPRRKRRRYRSGTGNQKTLRDKRGGHRVVKKKKDTHGLSRHKKDKDISNDENQRKNKTRHKKRGRNKKDITKRDRIDSRSSHDRGKKNSVREKKRKRGKHKKTTQIKAVKTDKVYYLTKKKNRTMRKKHHDDKIFTGKLFDTYQFTLRHGKRLQGFFTLNCRGKDYSLVQCPTPGTRHYYFITDRKKPWCKTASRGLEYTLEKYKDELGTKIFQKILKSYKNRQDEEGTGFLEIMVCDAVYNRAKKREVFYNPRFTNIKGFQSGDKLGFALFYNNKDDMLEIYYSANGDIHRAVSKDGVTFSYDRIMDELNSPYMDRDPSISRDGKVIAFASSRDIKADINGLNLVIARRDKVTERFSLPVVVSYVYNSSSNLFPSIYSTSFGTFIFVKMYMKIGNSIKQTLSSIEIKGDSLLPFVPFNETSNVPYKYITISYSKKRGARIMSSYPHNDYDLYRMRIEMIKKVKVNSVGEIKP